MDPMDVLKNMQGLSEDFLTNPGTQQQMKSFWNMLDEMAANNPEVRKSQEYSKFINSNLKSGVEDIKLQSGKQKVPATFSYCIKTYTKGKKKIVLINFCMCPHVLQPLKADKSKSDVFNLDTWTTIPASFSKQRSKKSPGKKENIYFDAFVHPCVTEAAFKDIRCKAQISLAVLKRLEVREEFLLTYEQGDFEYFESYKGPNGEDVPEAQFLELAADPEEYEKFIKRKEYLDAKEKDKFEGLKTQISNTKSNFEILTKGKVEEIEEKNELVNKKIEEIKENTVQVKSRPVLIEEIRNFEVCVNGLKNDGNVEVSESPKEIIVFVALPKENGLKNIELEGSDKSIKIKCPSFICEIKFLTYKIRDIEIGAKWLKSKKQLVITCPR